MKKKSYYIRDFRKRDIFGFLVMFFLELYVREVVFKVGCSF